MDTIPQDDVSPTTLVEDLVRLDRTFDDAQAKRNALVNKLSGIVDQLTIDTAKPRETEVQIALINAYAGILGANEASASRRVSSKIKQLEANSSSKHSAVVAEFLSRLDVNNIQIGTTRSPQDVSQVDACIEKTFSDRGLSPVMETELKTDPKDTDG